MISGLFSHFLNRLVISNADLSKEFVAAVPCRWISGVWRTNEKRNVIQAYFNQALHSQTLEIQYSLINKVSPWFIRTAEKMPDSELKSFLCLQTTVSMDEQSLLHRLWYPTQTDIPVDWLMEISEFDPNQEQWIFHIDLSYIFNPTGSAWHYFPDEHGNFNLERIWFNDYNISFKIPWKKRSTASWFMLKLLKPIAFFADLFTFPLQLLFLRKI